MFSRPAAKDERNAKPDREVDDRAADVAAPSQVRLTQFDQVLVPGIRMQPRAIQMRHSRDNREKQHRHQRQSLHRSLKLAANHHPPLAAGQVLNHQESHAAQRNAKP